MTKYKEMTFTQIMAFFTALLIKERELLPIDDLKRRKIFLNIVKLEQNEEKKHE